MFVEQRPASVAKLVAFRHLIFVWCTTDECALHSMYGAGFPEFLLLVHLHCV